ncbi:hypothetical protein CVIRNUC_002956 [Coccomyxa viridis]|uniref:UBA domain-containing protein n=1 Tax=Coccomyxa viridis TaxID=1274662 RepID=A0AAV1HYQ7_9CHLO|nr:hypothetical protein CVIRNUC_002956 [Coccomyxa viridis]
MIPHRGFKGCPISKGLLIATSITSVYFLSSFSKRAKTPLLLNLLAFSHPGTLLLGSALLYLTSTTLERQAGSSQYASFVCVALAIHAVIQNLERQKGPLTNGPLPCLFASMTLYMLETPSVQKFTLMGVQLTEKVFPIVAAAQLLIILPPSALWTAAAGVGYGALYSANCLGIRRHLKIPACIASPLGRLARRALGDSITPGRSAQVVMDSAERPRAYSGGQGPAVHATAVQMPAGVVASREALEQLTNMGFTEARARTALEQCDNNVQAAASLLL